MYTSLRRVCDRKCVCVFQSIKGKRTALARCGWNVTRLTAPCCGTQIPQTSPAKGPFLSCLQTLTHTQLRRNTPIQHAHYNTHCSEITQKQSESCGLCGQNCAVTLKGNFIWLTETCECVRVVCVFSTPGGVSHLGC